MTIKGGHSGSGGGKGGLLRCERKRGRIREGGKMGQFYQTETRPKSSPKHGELGKKTRS